MTRQPCDDTDAPVLNVLQFVVLDVVLTALVFAGLTLSGGSWLHVLAGAWLGGLLLTLAVAALLCLKNARPMQAKQVRNAPGIAAPEGPALVTGQIGDALRLWEEDRLLELDYVATRESARTALRPARVSPAEAIAMWEDDAETDAVEKGAVSYRPPRSDRA
jgi:hypothetical protein